MTAAIILICILGAGVGAVWLTPYRQHVVRLFSRFDQYKFTGRVEQITDLQQSENQDTFFQVSMIGRLPVPDKKHDTEVRITIRDITESVFNPLAVLTVSDQFRAADDASFELTADHGPVPNPESVLAEWVQIAQIPCHLLRFAYRGRRKLQFEISIFSKHTRQEIVSDRQVHEYVSCVDGYMELRQRRMDVLKASVNLVLPIFDDQQVPAGLDDFLVEWISRHTNVELPGEHINSIVEAAQQQQTNFQQDCDVLMAYGSQKDRLAVVRMALETAIFRGYCAEASFHQLSRVVSGLDIPKDRFLELSQKIILSSDCVMESPSQLLGISGQMPQDAFLKRLNAEYRKWNARVTHPEATIRKQADRILTLIANLRSERLQSCS